MSTISSTGQATDALGQLRQLFGQLLGWGFSGQRDYNKVFGYPEKIDLQAYLYKYQRQDIAGRIIDAPAEGTWRGYPVVSSNTRFDKQFEDFTKEYSLWSLLDRLDRVTALGYYGCLLIGFDDVHSAEDLSKPVAEGNRQVLYMLRTCSSTSRSSSSRRILRAPSSATLPCTD